MILHVDLDAFFASVEQRDNPRLRGKPLIVGSPVPFFFSMPLRSLSLPRAQSGTVRHLAQRGVVATASYEARKYGIYSGMPLSRAAKLCPHAFFVAGNFAKYEQASEQFVRICSSYSPVIEQISLDELYIDLNGTELIWLTPRWVAQKIQERVKKEIGITCSIGIAAQKTVAKIASGFNKPNGITEVPHGREKEFLAPMPISEIPGCGRQTQKMLKDLNIKIIREFSEMLSKHVELLIGKNGLHLWRVANGMDDSQVTPPQDAKSISRSTTFPMDTNSHAFLESILIYLCQRVARDLRKHGVAGRCVSLTVRTCSFETFNMQKTLSRPISTGHELFFQTKSLLNNLWDKHTKLRLIGVGVSSFNQLKQQIHLIEMGDGIEKWNNLEKAMDKVRNKYGFLSITPASLMKLKGRIL